MADQHLLKALRPNVGHLLKQATSFSRPLEIDLSAVTLGEDCSLEQLQGQLMLTRTSQGIWVDGTLTGATTAECARCLELFTLPLNIRLQELFYYPASNAPSLTDYVITDDGTLNLTNPIREQLVLDVPIRPLCKPDCKGLCSQCGENLNLGECNCDQETIDPRLEGLRQLQRRISEE